LNSKHDKITLFIVVGIIGGQAQLYYMSLSKQIVTIHARRNSGKMQTMIIPTLYVPTPSMLMMLAKKKINTYKVMQIKKNLAIFGSVNKIFINGVKNVWRG